MYNTTAFLYERTCAFEVPQTTCEEIHAALLQAGVHPPGLLGDLGAGTGLMSVLFAERGWHIHGVERSLAMIAEAENKKIQLPQAVQSRLHWTEGDITRFEMPEGLLLDAAVCLCNTINHLVEWPQVEGFIRSAYNALKPNGVLILDSDTVTTFERFFDHAPVVVWDDGIHRMTRTCRFDGSSGRAHHTAILERHDETGWTMVSEEGMQLQYHQEPKLYKAFLAQGFIVESGEPYNPFPVLYQGIIPKLLWVLRKPA